MKNIVIIGAGGFAREVAWLIKEINNFKVSWNFLGYVEQDMEKLGQFIGGAPIVMDDRALLSHTQSLDVVIAVGNPKVVLNLSSKLRTNSYLKFPNLIHPNILWDENRVSKGVGNIICAGNIFTTDISFGDFNIFNLSSTYGHDVKIGDCNVINPGSNISGNVVIGNGCLIGTGAVILEKLTIGNQVTVGGGAVVTKNVADGLTVVGVPAKPLMR